ncbi:MAG: L-threonylcarbamoyladenylate synthase [Armatimonadota bacterium]|nr:L-threonylcarbamoyladenylate synthase [Armatimonadota bacterium]MDR7444940.1 L-threonylcarbamoyladenylate synthase [Armatimonadota bacterium]MDR7570828.1 L-threonylcarbamoyladenylate synthase [Armatimonadota bacterium]MDR7615125.1 L-threonylcarbamoyladenylate synthase [Armatimonadota bacterium]
MARVVPATPETIGEAARILRRGGLVAFPTETVYGLGANALDPVAVARVFEVKRRPAFDPLIVHVCDRTMLEEVVLEIPPLAQVLIRRFWPGPLTLVLRRRPKLPGIVTAGLDTVAVREPSHPVALELIRCAETPVAAPSANPFGRLSPTRAEHVARHLGEEVDLILDAGPTPHGIESTIVSVLGETPQVLRVGAVPVEELEAVLGPVEVATSARRPQAPGQLPSHYAPRTHLSVARAEEVPVSARPRSAYLAFQRPPEDGFAAVRVLSPRGDLREAAARLFDLLHELDGLGLERIYAEPVPETGLGRAIMDRLRRASAAEG